MEKMIDGLVKEYVEKKNTAQVRDALATLAYAADKKAFKEFVDSAEYAIKEVADLFEDDIDCEFEEKNSPYKTAAAKLMSNFSKAKYEEVLRIGEEIFTEKGEPEYKQETYSKENETSDSPFVHSNQNSKKIGAAVLIAVAVILYLIARSISKH